MEWLDFSIWKSGSGMVYDFPIKVKDCNDLGEIIYLFDKNIYNLDVGDEASDWVRNKREIGISAPHLSSGLKVKDSTKSSLSINALGYSILKGNNVIYNNQLCLVLSSCFSDGNGFSITKDNFSKFNTLFTARKSITGKYANWINDKDEYMAPNESHPLWQQFQYDSLVYSLFNTSSNQSSLRQIKYKEKLWDIKNEFFWMSKSEIMELAENKYFDDVYRDARSSDERYVYTLLHKEGLYEKLSPDAKEVLDMASDLVRLTFDMREILHTEHPEYHLNTWDAGWYQIKLILKAFYPEQLKEFTKKYKEFEDRMRPLVYELGFLRK